jgi:hypothetical protein
MLLRIAIAFVSLLFVHSSLHAAEKSALSVDKEHKAVILDCKIAPRKLPNLKEKYPIEVIATWPSPKGQKAHETVVTFEGVKPSEVHKALESLGLKPGKPTRDAAQKPEGPQLALLIEIPDDGGKTRRIPIEEALVQIKSGERAPNLQWLFTGSTLREPDPEKDDKVYGADLTGTLIAIFPVTDDTAVQSNLSAAEEKSLKLDTNVKVLPKEGTPVKLILQVK